MRKRHREDLEGQARRELTGPGPRIDRDRSWENFPSPGGNPDRDFRRQRTTASGKRWRRWWLALALSLAGAAPLAAQAQKKGAEILSGLTTSQPRDPGRRPLPESDAPIQIQIGPYFGWDRSFTISNGRVEAVVVPAIGRVMQFRFLHEPGPFWENPALRGTRADPASSEWANFGGDKAWPAPQSEWGVRTRRSWPPPVAFDAMPVEMFVRRDTVVMRSPVDPHFGIRTERVVALDHDAPVLTITTTFEKVEGPPCTVAVWIVTQLEDPEGVYARLPSPSIFPEGYDRQSASMPVDLKAADSFLSLRRHPLQGTKIGCDASRLLWVGKTQMLLIESPRCAGANYPDHQSSAEIYTNPDSLPYVELEMLGPLHEMASDDRISQTNRYTLLPRTQADPERDAHRALLFHSLKP